MNKKSVLAGIMVGLLCFGITGCNNSSRNENNGKEGEITVVLDWTPNTNHTGLYVAVENGYFEEEGLNVKIQEPPQDGATVLVASGKAQFGFDFQEYLAPAYKPGEELEVTAIASIIQHNTSGLISLKEKGIESPKDLQGHTYSSWDMEIEKAIIRHIIEKDGGNYNKLEIIPSTVTDVTTALKTGQTDLVWVYYAWDGIATKVQGIETNFIDFGKEDSNLDFYSPVLIANNSYLNENAEEAKAFMSALKKGYEFAIENPDEAAAILCKAVPELDEQIVKESQNWLADKYQADAPYWGYIEPERWDGFYKWLYDNKAIDYKISAGTGFSNDYIR